MAANASATNASATNASATNDVSQPIEASTERPGERPAPSPGNPLLNAMRVRDFRLLWIGQGASLLGDQFGMIAFPWLVLQLTGDALALGAVMALMAIPRALFMLVGGAVTDRLSSRAVMLASDAIRLVMTLAVAWLALHGHIQMWMVYAMALISGTVSGFFMPASGAIMPTLVDKKDLQGANSLFQGTAQLTNFLGPVLAGGLIVWFSPRGITTLPRLTGVGMAFMLDGLTFLVSLVTLWLIRSGAQTASKAAGAGGAPGTDAGGPAGMLASIREGVVIAMRDPGLRMVFIIIPAVNMLFVGPLLIGIPVLAQLRLPEGAAAFGLIMSGYGGGNLLGYILSGNLKMRRFGPLVTVLIVAFGIGAALIGLSYSTLLSFAILLVLGVGNGAIGLLFITWLQRNTPEHRLGRMMSLVYLTNVGLMPISEAASGLLSRLSATGLFLGAGVLMVLTGLWGGTRKEL
jgi:MFS family permease